MRTAEAVAYLAFNFGSSVLIIFLNKALFSGSLRFEFTCALTVFHYLVNLIGLEMLHYCGVYERRDSPTTPRMALLAFVVGAAPALNNVSLKYNGLGFYQIVKLLVTPCIVAMEFALYGHRLSAARAVALLVVCLGVGIAVVNDVTLNAAGVAAALCWVPIAATYKVLWSRVAKEEGWGTLQLMRRVLPLATLCMLPFVAAVDPPGITQFDYTERAVLALTASGVAAFFVNLSGFLVLGACSALTHTVLGQLKSVAIILGGWLIFSQAYPPKALCGAALALAAIIWYTQANLHEQEQRARLDPAGSALPKKETPPVAAAPEHQGLLDAKPRDDASKSP